MGLRRKIELRAYRLLRPIVRERRELPPGLEIPDYRPRGLTTPRGSVAAVAITAVLASGGGMLIGDSWSEAPQSSGEDVVAIQGAQDRAERRRDHGVCLAEHQAREGEDAGVFSAADDSKLDQCYAEQEAQAAEIRVEADQ